MPGRFYCQGTELQVSQARNMIVKCYTIVEICMGKDKKIVKTKPSSQIRPETTQGRQFQFVVSAPRTERFLFFCRGIPYISTVEQQ